jgi:hypothetical protein
MFNLIKQIFDAAAVENAIEVTRLRKLAIDEFKKTHFPSFADGTYDDQDRINEKAEDALNKTLAFLSQRF